MTTFCWKKRCHLSETSDRVSWCLFLLNRITPAFKESKFSWCLLADRFGKERFEPKCSKVSGYLRSNCWVKCFRQVNNFKLIHDNLDSLLFAIRQDNFKLISDDSVSLLLKESKLFFLVYFGPSHHRLQSRCVCFWHFLSRRLKVFMFWTSRRDIRCC